MLETPDLELSELVRLGFRIFDQGVCAAAQALGRRIAGIADVAGVGGRSRCWACHGFHRCLVGWY